MHLKRAHILLAAIGIIILAIISLSTSSYILISRYAPQLSKNLAKTYLAAIDLENIIMLNSEKIQFMTQSSYERKISRMYDDLVSLGGKDFAQAYNIRREIPKKEVLSRLQRLTKPKIANAIDAFPSTVITSLIRRDLQNIHSIRKLKELLNRIKQKTDKELNNEYFFLKQSHD